MPPVRPRLLLWIAAAAAGLLVQAPALAQYTWKDAKGQLHASDQPPPRDVPDKDVIRRPAARAAAQPAAGTAQAASGPASAPSRPVAASAPVDPELQQRKARAEQEAKAKAQAEEQRLAGVRAQNCQRARAHLATLDSGSRLVRINERGERVVVDDNTRAQEAAQARSVVATECR